MIGIDFGTTNSLCAWMDGDQPLIIPNDRGERATPSALARTEAGELLVGASAKTQALADPSSSILGVKRLLGKQASVRLSAQDYEPEDLAAAVLRKLKLDAERYLGFELTEAVITVRARFEELALPYIERSMALVRKVLASSGSVSRSVDALVLSGGSSRIPLVSSMLEGLSGRRADPRVNLEEIVAQGAAIEAARLDGSLPSLGQRVFTTVEDYQKSVEMHVLQIDEDTGGGRVSVGRFLLPGIRAAKRGEPRILVEFALDEGDMLKVRAKDLDSGAEQAVSFFDGRDSMLKPVEKALSLAVRARREAEGAGLDSALMAELEALCGLAMECSRTADNEKAMHCATLLEGLLSELAARSGRRIMA